MKRWAREHDRCVRCCSTRFPHKGRGYCKACYEHFRYESDSGETVKVCENCGKPNARVVSKRCPTCRQYRIRTGNERPAFCYKRYEPPQEPVKPKSDKKQVSVPRWELYGTLACKPYVFLGQKVCDIYNQHGERIMQIPFHLIELGRPN